MSDKPWLAHYDKGVPQTIEYPKVPMFHFLEEAARKYPDRACTIFKGAVISYKEMNEKTDHMAAALVEMGVKKGDRVGIFMPNTPQFMIAYFGILKAGGVVVAVNPTYPVDEILIPVNDANIEIMFTLSRFYGKLKTVRERSKLKRIIVTNIKETLPPITRLLFTLVKEKKEGDRVESLADGDVWMQDLLAKHTNSPKPSVEVTPDDTALFQYSGGTTGTPKGAVAMHRNVVANTLQIKSWMAGVLDEGKEVVLMGIPLFHVYGMVAGMNFGMVVGASLVMVPNARDLKDVLVNISKYKASIFPGVPLLYNGLNNHPDVKAGKYDLSSIKACISGSAPLMRETKDEFERLTGGKLFEAYGLSEAPTGTHGNPMNGENKVGSIGMPLPDVDCRLVSLDDGETELAQGEIGEIIINGPQVMKGYHNMPTETANVLRQWKGKTWLFTGDIARMDEDGYFYIVDRKKELIKPGGFQVWPREVEEAIMDHPKVLEVGVGGIPDPQRGEAVKAWVVLKPGETVTESELKAFCKEHLAPYKIPSHIEFRTELPKTTVGKILRRELIRQHKEGMK